MSKVIGLTGGIGSGKTAVTDYLASQGYAIVDSDVISRQVVMPNSIGLKKIIEAFGADYLNKDQTLNREKLRALIFSEPEKKQQLEAILHPLIQEQTQRQIDELSKQNKPYIFVAIPLLIEVSLKKGKPSYIDEIWVVESSIHNQIARASQRDGASEEEIKRIIYQQASAEQRAQFADQLIQNNDNLANLYQQIDKLIANSPD